MTYSYIPELYQNLNTNGNENFVQILFREATVKTASELNVLLFNSLTSFEFSVTLSLSNFAGRYKLMKCIIRGKLILLLSSVLYYTVDVCVLQFKNYLK